MHRTLLGGLALLCLALCGCFGASASRMSYGGAGSAEVGRRARATTGYGPSIDVVTTDSTGGGGGGGDTEDEEYPYPREPSYEFSGLALGSSLGGLEGESGDDDYRGDELRAEPGSAVLDTTVARSLEEDRGPVADASDVVATAGETGTRTAETMSDAGAGPLLIYTAGIWLAVYEVRESQATIVARTEELGGHVQHQTDTELVLRVPAPQFDALVEAVTGVGDLLHRELAADDVSEEFRDVEIRIRNLEAMRQRLEVLLTQATAVEDALRVERELERVTVELERLRGRQRFLTDRIAFSTITVHFEARPRDRIDQPEIFALPFYWLQNLGLPGLLDLH